MEILLDIEDMIDKRGREDMLPASIAIIKTIVKGERHALRFYVALRGLPGDFTRPTAFRNHLSVT